MIENNNFKCTKCNNEFFVQKYSSSVDVETLKSIYKEYRSKKILACPSCLSEELEFIYPILEGDIAPLRFQKFGSMTPVEKQAFLRKRSKEDAKKQQYVQGYNEMERDEKRKYR